MLIINLASAWEQDRFFLNNPVLCNAKKKKKNPVFFNTYRQEAAEIQIFIAL